MAHLKHVGILSRFQHRWKTLSWRRTDVTSEASDSQMCPKAAVHLLLTVSSGVDMMHWPHTQPLSLCSCRSSSRSLKSHRERQEAEPQTSQWDWNVPEEKTLMTLWSFLECPPQDNLYILNSSNIQTVRSDKTSQCCLFDSTLYGCGCDRLKHEKNRQMTQMLRLQNQAIESLTHTRAFVQLSLCSLYTDIHSFVQPNPNLNQFMPYPNLNLT